MCNRKYGISNPFPLSDWILSGGRQMYNKMYDDAIVNGSSKKCKLCGEDKKYQNLVKPKISFLVQIVDVKNVSKNIKKHIIFKIKIN